jgi:hypothetical protein
MLDDAQTQAETTAEASSAENQTPETTPEPIAENTPVEPQEDSKAVKAVPYERFSEVVKTKNELEARIAELESQKAAPHNQDRDAEIQRELDRRIKALGYVSKAELEVQEADRKLEKNIQSLSEKYSGKDGRPKFERNKVLEYASDNLIGNLEVAYKQMHEAELLDYAIKQATGKLKPTRTEVSDGSGSTQIGTTQDDLLRQAQSGDDQAMKTLIKRAL